MKKSNENDQNHIENKTNENIQLKNLNQKFITDISNLSKLQLLQLINITIESNSYNDTLLLYSKLYTQFPNSNTISIKLLTNMQNSLKSLVTKKQQQYSKLLQIEDDTVSHKNKFPSTLLVAINSEKDFIANEIKNNCFKILDIVDNYILKNINEQWDIVCFIFKIKGDIFKYLLSVTNEKETFYYEYLNNVKENYMKGFNIGCKYLEGKNKIFMQCILSLTDFYMEILKKTDEIKEILKNYFEVVKVENNLDDDSVQYLNKLKNIYDNLNNN